MNLGQVLAMVSAGGAFALAGLLLLAAAAAAGLTAAGLPLWLSLLILGAAFLIVGGAMAKSGGEQTVAKVEKQLTVGKLFENYPWAVGAAGAVGVMMLYRLLRPAPISDPTVVNVKMPGKPGVTAVVDSASPDTVTLREGPRVDPLLAMGGPPPEESKWKDSLKNWAGAASGIAAGIGMKALGIPTRAELVSALFDKASALFVASPKKDGPAKAAETRSSGNGVPRRPAGAPIM